MQSKSTRVTFVQGWTLINLKNKMKRLLLSLLVICAGCVTTMAQVPYFGATVGEGNVFGYTSVKVRPGQNAMEDYTTLQFGVTDWFSIGTDIYASKETVDHGLYARVGWKWNQWISAGSQVCYQSNLRDNYLFSNVNAGIFLNGDILENGCLFWTSNTWLTFYQDGNCTYKQWWYLGSNIHINKSQSLVPMIGLIHSWKFEQPADLAIGAYYVYKKYSFYLWGNDFLADHPRLTIALDFTF